MLALKVVVILLTATAGNLELLFHEEQQTRTTTGLGDAALHLGLKTLAISKEENAVVSPLNLYSCLWLLYAGAKADTKSELQNLMGATVADPSLPTTPEVYTANALFIAQGVSVKDSYIRKANPAIIPVNFRKTQNTTDTINSWVAQETRETIPKFLQSPLDTASVAVVISALYFNAAWMNIFNRSLTRRGEFEIFNGAPIKVPLMTLNAQLPVMHSSNFKALGLPYANPDYTFYVILPHASGPMALKSLLRQLTPQMINDIVEEMQEENIVVTLPKFTLDVKTELRPVLRSLGINKIFDPVNADFSDLFEKTEGPKFFVSDIFQSVHLRVDEGGTEGSAVTAAVVTKSGRATFRATRPFIFLLRHSSGHVLFLGTVNRPTL